MNGVALVHGIRSCDPSDTMGRLAGSLFDIGINSHFVSYGYILVPINNHRAVDAIESSTRHDSIIVGYSNGAAAIHKAVTKDKISPKHIVLISPALKRDVEWPDGVETITVFYSPGDNAVMFGGIWATIANSMPWRWGSAREHPWGRMGLLGPSSDDHRYVLVKMGDHVAHSWFKHSKIVNRIAERINFLVNKKAA